MEFGNKTYLFVLGFSGDFDQTANSDGDSEAERQVDGFSQRPGMRCYWRVDGLTQSMNCERKTTP